MMHFKIQNAIWVFFLTGALTVSGCKIAGSKRPTQANDLTVMNYFSADQYAIDNDALASAMSSLNGFTMVAPLEATFANWSQPAPGCLFKTDDGLNFSPRRAVDMGAVKLSGLGLLEDLAKDPSRLTFSITGRLLEGDYRLTGTDNPSVGFDQSFKVLAPGSQLQVLSGPNGTLQNMPSPQIPASTDPDYTLTVQKNEPFLVSFQAPVHTDYVKVEMSDGTNTPEGTVVCYGVPSEPVVFTQGAFSYFRSTEDGRITVEFVASSLSTEFPKIKESFIRSSVKHIHGLVDFYTSSGKQTARFGKLKFE